MNEENSDIINKFLLIGDKFMPEMHLWDSKVKKYSAYAKYKDRTNRKQSDIVLKNKALKIATDPRVNGYQRGLASMVYKFFNERTKGPGINNKGNLLANSQLAEELHKPITKKF